MSPSDTMPDTRCCPSTTTMRRIWQSFILVAASLTSSSSLQQTTSELMASRTFVVRASRPSATPRTTMSRSVIIPTRRSPSVTGMGPTSSDFILAAASWRVWSGRTVSTDRVITSLIFMRASCWCAREGSCAYTSMTDSMASAAARQAKSAYLTPSADTRERFVITRLRSPEAERQDTAREVREGLTAEVPALPSKFFYDARGSALFERITMLPEYYPTRVEEAIHARVALEIVRRTRPAEWVELGSGLGTKTRRMLDAIAAVKGRPAACILLDVDEAALRASLTNLTLVYPMLRARGIVGDFLRDIAAIGPSQGNRMMGFLGGTIGNLHPDSVPGFLRAAASVLAPGDSFLLGVDLVKDVARLEAAYNDRAGVTAEFNRNILRVVNARLGADFEVEAFEHVAFYDTTRHWIEMRLRATRATAVHIPEAGIDRAFAAGDEIRTEISCKYTRDRFADVLSGTGLAVDAWHTDAAAQFAVVPLRRA